MRRKIGKYTRMSIDNEVQDQDYDSGLAHQESSPEPLQKLYKKRSKKSKFMNKASSVNPIISNQVHYVNNEAHEDEQQPIAMNVKKNRRYKSNTNQQDQQDCQLDQQAQNYRITFNRSPELKVLPHSKQLKRINKRTPIKNLQSQNDQKLKSIQLKNLLMTKNSSVGSQTLKQAVVDLQQHNKSIMQQAKKTVEDFQQYIQSLLQTNAQLSSVLLQYQEYINQLQNEKIDLIETQKQRQQQFQKAIKQKMKVEKQIKIIQTKLEQKQKERRQSNKLKEEQKFFKDSQIKLREEIQNKQRIIKMLQQAINQKEQNIRKMANFNNQMCLQILQLKNKKFQQNQQSVQDLQQESNTRKKIKKKQDTISTLMKQNENLRRINHELQQEIRQLIHDDQLLLNQMKKQSKKIQFQQQNRTKLIKRLDMYGKINEFQSSVKQVDQSLHLEPLKTQQKLVPNEQNGIIQIKQATFRIKQRGQDQLNQRQQSSISSISKKDQQVLFKNYDVFIQSQQNAVILQKVRNLLKVAYKLLKSSKKNQKLRQTINRLIKMMNQIGGVDAEVTQYNRSQVNFLTYLEQQQRAPSGSFKNIVHKNEQMLSRINKLRKKIKNHIQNPSYQSRQSDPLYRYRDNGQQHIYSQQFYPSYGLGKNSDTTRSCDVLGLSKDNTKSTQKQGQLYGSAHYKQ